MSEYEHCYNAAKHAVVVYYYSFTLILYVNSIRQINDINDNKRHVRKQITEI